MKQQPTIEQWNELSDEEKNHFLCGKKGTLPKNRWVDGVDTLPTIGQLIEYLGEDLRTVLHHTKGFSVGFGGIGSIVHSKWFKAKELIDALHEAVKYKLKNK